MKRLLIASIAITITASSYAMPNSSGENTYSAQGTATKVRILSSSRNIPAPSSWTPPERIPSPRVTYVKRDQPKRLGGGFDFTVPHMSSPNFSAPNFTNAVFSTPNFTTPNMSIPNSPAPVFSAPNYNGSVQSNPSFSSPVFSNPGF